MSASKVDLSNLDKIIDDIRTTALNMKDQNNEWTAYRLGQLHIQAVILEEECNNVMNWLCQLKFIKENEEHQ